jgi:hypothetical protein
MNIEEFIYISADLLSYYASPVVGLPDTGPSLNPNVVSRGCTSHITFIVNEPRKLVVLCLW